MTILVDGRVHAHQRITGVERYYHEITNALKKESFPMHVLQPKRSGRLNRHLWEHVILPLKSRKYDLLFCPANIAPYVRMTRTVTTIHSLAFMDQPESYSHSFLLYYNFLISRVLRTSDHLITVSEAEKDNILKKFPACSGRITAIYPGVASCFRSRAVAKKDGEHFLWVGSGHPLKNLKKTLDAFCLIKDRTKRTLVIAGLKWSDLQRPGLRDTIERIGRDRIKPVGSCSAIQMAELYGDALLLIFPSLYESFGFPAVEAMASGCPVIASDIPALREVCADAAVYADPKNAEGFADAILRLTEDAALHQHLKTAGLKRAERFTWERAASEHVRVFEETMR